MFINITLPAGSYHITDNYQTLILADDDSEYENNVLDYEDYEGDFNHNEDDPTF